MNIELLEENKSKSWGDRTTIMLPEFLRYLNRSSIASQRLT